MSLLLALEAHEDTLCPGCGHPKEQAWHSEMDGWYEATKVVCHGCTSTRPAGDEVAYAASIVDARGPGARPLPPFVLGKTTTTPAKD